MNERFSLNTARLTAKGIELLEENKLYMESYPERSGLKAWIQVDKELYSNGAEAE